MAKAFENRPRRFGVKTFSLCTAVLVTSSAFSTRAQLPVTSERSAGKPYQSKLQAIAHVTVINPRDGANEEHDMTILVLDGKIVSVGHSSSTKIPAAAVIHNETGRFVIPGLWDTHVHLTQVGPRAFPLFLANGITSVRDMGSDLIEIRQWQESRNLGALIPRILTPGPKLDGMSLDESLRASYRPDRFIVTSPETGRAIVDALKKAKVDFIKVHNDMTPEIYQAIAKEAHMVGLSFDGHLPTAGPHAAAAAGQRTLEHGQRMLPCSAADWQVIHAEPKAEAKDDETRCATLSDQATMYPAIVHAGEWLTPTLVVWRSGSMIGSSDVNVWAARLSGSSQVWPELRTWWASQLDAASPTDFQRHVMREAPAMAAAASRAGVPLLAGTDLGDPYIVPGFALHDELELMVAAGVPTLKALQSATSEPATAFGLSSTLGSISAGQSADLLILEDDPLTDIGNTRHISAVLFNGEWIARE